MNIGKATEHLRVKGGIARRGGWTVYIELQVPDANSKMTCPYLFVVDSGLRGSSLLVPWQPGQLDLLADDWELGYVRDGVPNWAV